jgi:hypothetical protein
LVKLEQSPDLGSETSKSGQFLWKSIAFGEKVAKATDLPVNLQKSVLAIIRIVPISASLGKII